MIATKDKIDPTKVVSVYSGRPGCACGCRGKHTYASATAEEVSKKRGFAVPVSDNTVHLIVGKMNALIEGGGGARMWSCEDEEFLSIETPTRLYIAYFR